jgi:hypothetical protein
MKKAVLAMVMALALSAAVWVEDSVPTGGKLFEVTIDLVKDIAYKKQNSGEFANRETPARTYVYAGDDTLTFLNLKKEMFDTSNLFVKFGYAGDSFGGLIRFAMNPRTLDDQSSFSAVDLIDIYYGWAKIGLFKLWIGRDEYRGIIERYQNFDDFLGGKNDSFGPIIVGYDYLASRMLTLAGSDVTNLGKDILGNKSTVLIGELAYKPITLSLAVNNLYSRNDGKGTNESNFEDSYTDFGSTFGARIEAAKLFNMLNLAAVYKFQHSDRKYDEQQFQDLQGGQSFFVPEMGLDHHLFGLFATVTPPLPGLGISAGYSGYLKKHKDMDAASWGGWTSYQYPLWHGIDLRINYTGIKKLSLTLNSNLTFSTIQGDDDPKSFITGFWENINDVQDVGPNQEQNALVLYGAFAVAYDLIENLTVKLQAANQFAKIEYIYNESETKFIDTVNFLGLYLGADWRINSLVSIRGGFDMRLKNYSHDEHDSSSEAGVLEWGIPLGLTVKF